MRHNFRNLPARKSRLNLTPSAGRVGRSNRLLSIKTAFQKNLDKDFELCIVYPTAGASWVGKRHR